MTLSIIGIDLAKLKFDLCLLCENDKLKHKVFLNNAAGCAQLSTLFSNVKEKKPSNARNHSPAHTLLRTTLA